MNDDRINMQIRKFLKQVGVTSQRELERALYEAEKAGRMPAGTTIPLKITLEAPDLGIVHVIAETLEIQ